MDLNQRKIEFANRVLALMAVTSLDWDADITSEDCNYAIDLNLGDSDDEGFFVEAK